MPSGILIPPLLTGDGIKMDTLGILFGSPSRIKILRLFLLNPLEAYDVKEIAVKSRVRITEARKETHLLKKVGFIMEKNFTKEILVSRGSKKVSTKKRMQGFQLKASFPLLLPLKNLIISETPLSRNDILKRFRTAGKIKLLILSGIFIDEPDARVDVFIVGDNLKRRSIENTLRFIEAEVGKELSYGALETSEFLYRVSVYDKFIRDILDTRHERVVDNLGVE